MIKTNIIIVSVLLSEHVETFSFSRIRDFVILLFCISLSCYYTGNFVNEDCKSLDI